MLARYHVRQSDKSIALFQSSSTGKCFKMRQQTEVVSCRWSCWTACLMVFLWVRSTRWMWRWRAVGLWLSGAAARAPGTRKPSAGPGVSLCSLGCSNHRRRTCSSLWWEHCRSVLLRFAQTVQISFRIWVQVCFECPIGITKKKKTVLVCVLHQNQGPDSTLRISLKL